MQQVKINIDHIAYFLSNICKGAIDMKVSPDVSNDQSYTHIQRNRTIDVKRLSYL